MNDASILICRCEREGLIPGARLTALEEVLRAAGHAFETVPDLCGVAARREPWLAEWVRRPGRKIIACHPRAIVNLFDAAGAPLPGDAVIANLRTGTVEAAAAALGLEGARGEGRGGEDGVGACAPETPPAPVHPPEPLPSISDAWLPWFPVIDRARCTACRQCAEFCLFGVYAVTDGRVEVRHPENCKPHCPACARICPRAAIIFPKHPEAPIDGSAISDEEAERARVRRDLHDLLGDDIDAALAERRRRAQARRLDPEKVRRALEERLRHAPPGTAHGPETSP